MLGFQAESSVWVVFLAASPVPESGLLRKYLSRTERAELLRLLPRRRDGWIASRLALKFACRRAIGPRALRRVAVRHDAAGRPVLSGMPGWSCSLSHTGPAGVGVVARRPVGVDLEPASRYARVHMRAAASEMEWTRVADAGVPAELAPTVLWTLKEAALKGAGLGLALHPRHAVITERREHDWIVCLDGVRARSSWSVASRAWREWTVAVAVPAAPRATTAEVDA